MYINIKQILIIANFTIRSVNPKKPLELKYFYLRSIFNSLTLKTHLM